MRRNNCIYATLVNCHSGRMTDMQGGMNSTLHSRQSSTQSDKYQVSHRYSYFCWWRAHIYPTHIEKRNKHTKKNCVPIWFIYKIIQGCTFNKNTLVSCQLSMAHIQVAYEEHYCHIGDVPVRLLIKAHQETVWCNELGALVKWLRNNTTEFCGTTQATTNVLAKYTKELPG